MENALQDAMESMNQIMQDYQQQSLETKRIEDVPTRKIQSIPSPTHKDNSKWKKFLSKVLISKGNLDKLAKVCEKRKKPAWSGKELKSNEYHVGIGASKEDLDFADIVKQVLSKRGLKVTTDQDDLHETRTFLLIYSDSVNMDENVIRHLTRAAERFNMGETIIIALVRPGCPEEVIDRIPDRVAYSLSNVVFFSHDWFGEAPEMARRRSVEDLAALIQNNVNETHDYDLSGAWLCQAAVTSSVTSYSTTRDFTMLLKQQGNKITGRTIDNFKIEGEVQKDILKLRISYRGEYEQNIYLWEEDDYFFIAEIAAVIHNQGYRLEGEYSEETDAGTISKSGASKFDACSGPFSATLEKQCLSGYYNAHWYSKPDYNETFAIIHRGGNEIIAEFPNQYGSLTVGFLDLVTKTLQLNSCSNRNMTRTLIGKLTEDSGGAASFQCLSYGNEFGLTGEPEAIALTRDQIHILKSVSEDDDDVLEKMQMSLSPRLQGMPFTPGWYQPLAEDEFPVVIFCTEHEKNKALKLKKDLETVQDIKPVSIQSSDWKKSRTIVLLLSKYTQSDEGLIDAIESAAEKEIPIFNIGLDSWFNIFGPANWKNQQLRLKLMNSLARLNQTPDTTLDPTHNNFRGLVKGIRKRIEPPNFNILGLFGVEVVGSDPPEKISKYSDLEDETIQLIKRPSMMYLYVDQSTNQLRMGTDYIVQGLTGEVDPQTFTLTMKNDAGSYELRVNADMDKFYGKYWSKRANKEYTIVVSKADSGISGFYAMSADQIPTGIVQLGKRTADIVFGGYTLPAMISDNKIIFNAPYPGQKSVKITYSAQILLKPEGNYLYGFSFQSQSTTARSAFDAKQFASGHQKILKKNNKDGESAEKWLVDLIEEFWRCSDAGDYEGFLKISKGDMSEDFSNVAFDKMVVDNRRSIGNYIKNSAVFLGKKAQVTMGKPIGVTRYDFKFDFEKLKQIEYSVTITDAVKKLNGIMSYEEEAELMHSSQYDVMISYRSWDARWVDLLQAFLESNGYTVWRDRRMDVGVNWSEDITKAVRRSGCVLAAISENYLTSVLCTKEVRMANDISKPIIPLVLPDTCPKDNPTEKLVSSAYKDKYLPITIATELADVSWIDFRPLANLQTPDPKDVESFGKKYESCLQSLLRMLEELMNHKRVVNLQGDWNLVIGSNENEENLKLSILSTIGSEIEGVMTSCKDEKVDITLDKDVSLCNGSNMHFVGKYKGNGKSLSYTFHCKIAADGNSFEGVCRIHKTPWEHPVGQPMNPLVLGLTHYTTTNDCGIYPVKGSRDKPLGGIEFKAVEQEEFILDLDRAYNILQNAFKDIKKEALEQSIISYKEAFEKYDVDGSHELDMNELELALRVANMNCSKAEKVTIMKELDQDDSGTVDFYEFLEFIAKLRESKGKRNTAAAQVVKKGFVTKVCVIQ
ncbi:uncharacterized protein LOC135685388 [Rhopilema esculentum]|uniref:uncharacterized protein LOC135685388 n=1 Tax=Rhopilema esculentum TaxID=499914 RepID=UPI0031E3F652